jgi:hypothetical protein
LLYLEIAFIKIMRAGFARITEFKGAV